MIIILYIEREIVFPLICIIFFWVLFNCANRESMSGLRDIFLEAFNVWPCLSIEIWNKNRPGGRGFIDHKPPQLTRPRRQRWWSPVLRRGARGWAIKSSLASYSPPCVKGGMVGRQGLLSLQRLIAWLFGE